MSTTEVFGEQYFRTNNYKDYLARKFDALASEILWEAKLYDGAVITDFGCGYGGLLAAMDSMGKYILNGTDISTWVISEGKRRYPHLAPRLQYYNRNLLTEPNDLLLFLDVLEHMPEHEVESTLKLARTGARGLVAVRIPVCAKEGQRFVLEISNNDPTHICCHTANWWIARLSEAGFNLKRDFGGEAIYRSDGVLAAMFAPQ